MKSERARDPAYELAIRAGLDFRPEADSRLRTGPIAEAPFNDALHALLTLSSRHDFWWPLFRGTARTERALVIEDSWGAAAKSLTQHVDDVTAVFPRREDSELLQSALAAESHVGVCISADPLREESLWTTRWPLIVLQRPSSVRGWQDTVDVSRLIERARESLTPDGVLIVIEDLQQSLLYRSLAALKRDTRGSSTGLKLRKLIKLAPDRTAWASQEKLEPATIQLPELASRRRGSLIGALREAKDIHGVSRFMALKLADPRSAVVMSYDKRPATIVDRALKHPAVVAASDGQVPELRRVLAGAGQTTVMLAAPPHRAANSVVLRMADNPKAAARVRANASMLNQLAATEFERITPRILFDERNPPEIYLTVESCLKGRPLLGLTPGPEKDDLLCRAVARWNEFREPRIGGAIVSSDVFQAVIGTAVSGISQYASQADAEKLALMASELKRRLVGRMWPLGPFHGDFKVGNILMDDRRAISGVIDWDCSAMSGLPLLDVITLVVYEDARDERRHLAESFMEGVVEGRWRPAYTQMIEDEASRLGLDAEAKDTLKAVFWLVNLRDRVHWIALSHDLESQRFLSKPLAQLSRLLGIDARAQS